MCHTLTKRIKAKNSRYNIIIIISTVLLNLIISSFLLQAESIPIETLKGNTKITNKNNRINISGGIKSGDNLIHYFSEFNLKSDSNLYFISPSTVNNIISIVNKNKKSNLDGNIFSKANIFILNKNGFILGNNLNITTSENIFIGTPNKIIFPDYKNDIFNTKTISFPTKSPINLIFSDNNGEIFINGNGHNIIQPGNIFLPNFGTGRSPDGIKITDAKNITFGAGEIIFNGGKLTVPDSNINLYAIHSGKIPLVKNKDHKPKNSLNNFGLISLDNKSLIDSSGGISNTLIFSKKLKLTNESLIIDSNPRNFGKSNINIFAKELEILSQNKARNIEQRFQTSRGIISQTFDGAGANIFIDTNQLKVDKSGAIIASTFGSGKGGNIDLISDNVTVSGGSKFGLNEIGSQILTTTARSGRGGNLNIRSNLTIKNGGFVAAAAFGEGNAGKLSVFSPETIILDGGIYNASQKIFIPSSLSTATISKGIGGDLMIKANDLLVINGARIDASSFAEGDAGSINLDASRVTISGKDQNSITPSSIKSASDTLNPFLSRIFDLKLSPSGNAGSLNINADMVLIDNSGELSVTSIGNGKSGDLQLNADLIQGKNSSITASTVNGNGGDIRINASLLTLQRSKIIANARQGKGGNISIDANASFFAENNLITATSELGPQFEGSIEINQKNQITFLNDQLIENRPSQLSFDPCTSDTSTISKHGSGQHFRTMQDKQLYAEGLKQRLAIAEQFTYTDPNGKEKPFRRWLGVQRKDDGKLEMVFSPEQSKVLQNLISSDISRCSQRS